MLTLKEQAALALQNAKQAYEKGDVDTGDSHKAEFDKLTKAYKSIEQLDEAERNMAVRPTLPGVGAGADVKSATGKQEKQEDEPDTYAEVVKSVYQMRFGDDSTVKSTVMQDLVGRDYKRTLYDQHQAFAAFIRNGERYLERDQERLLKTQIFPWFNIETMIKSGFDVSTIKATMVEAQGTLGGYAVPATMQSEIIQRLPGMTVVRGGGARVINLTGANSTEILKITGGDSRYTGAVRGSWGTETQAPGETNMTLGLETLNADIYTFKVPMSQSLVEDAVNLVSLLQDEATVAMAIDEDAAFLVGDGAGKPRGILPGGTNADSLTEVVSGNATLITADGVKKLKRGVAIQYRRDGVWVANSDTFEDIELLKNGEGEYLFDDMTDTETLLRRPVMESEAMVDVAAGAYPLIYGNMAGYTILERTGMTIARFQDSNTGINKVEFHFRRRVGGQVTHPWHFSTLKIASS